MIHVCMHAFVAVCAPVSMCVNMLKMHVQQHTFVVNKMKIKRQQKQKEQQQQEQHLLLQHQVVSVAAATTKLYSPMTCHYN